MAEPPPLPAGLAPKIVAFCEELRRQGVAVGTSEILDGFAAVSTIPWEQREDFREALAATLAKSQEDRRIFELIFDRFFFRATEREALEQGISEGEERFEGGERLDLEQLQELVRRAIAEGSEDEPWRPSVARARDPASSASTCNGSGARSACSPGRPRPARRSAPTRPRRSIARACATSRVISAGSSSGR
jgi:uncharacterized protein with von Willebrand factor type A (vWA) domain